MGLLRLLEVFLCRRHRARRRRRLAEKNRGDALDESSTIRPVELLDDPLVLIVIKLLLEILLGGRLGQVTVGASHWNTLELG